MKLLRRPCSQSLLFSFLNAYALILFLFLLLPLAASADVRQRDWAGNWLVVSEGDAQLVWQLNADGTGFAYGFQESGRLSHGFAINWKLVGDRVRVRTGARLRCAGGKVAVAFTGWSPVTLNFAIVDGRHWLQDGGKLLSFQRRLETWETPRAGGECPNLTS
ncbi:hypothetical protein [Microbulbifer halophilus]|uniref:DUF1850 domain-containing protein n=1 Tax=Microbulbifer halophilus TaxID=453963 RepID=A0ABW5EH66_9GAMM|nr:hypothetical protein [Microbulbifer halophilus]MCW8127850.1 hypothetical protein [Microbulbifer halophilus]